MKTGKKVIGVKVNTLSRLIFHLSYFIFFSSCQQTAQQERDAFFLRGNLKLQSREYGEAIRYYDEALRVDPNYAEGYNNRGIAHYEQAHYPEAITDYTRAINQRPDFTDAYYNRANAYYQRGEYEPSIIDLDTVLRYYPDSAYVHFTRGTALTGAQRYPRSHRGL